MLDVLLDALLDAFIGSVTWGLNVLQLPTRQLAFVLYRAKGNLPSHRSADGNISRFGFSCQPDGVSDRDRLEPFHYLVRIRLLSYTFRWTRVRARYRRPFRIEQNRLSSRNGDQPFNRASTFSTAAIAPA